MRGSEERRGRGGGAPGSYSKSGKDNAPTAHGIKLRPVTRLTVSTRGSKEKREKDRET